MESQNLIRRYEQLKQKKPKNLKEKAEMEKQWIFLYKDFKKSFKRWGKHQKKQSETLMAKTLEQALILSKELFRALIPKNETLKSFEQLYRENTELYHQVGVRVLCQLCGYDYDHILALTLANEKEELHHEIEWFTEIAVIRATSLKKKTLQELFSIEKKLVQLHRWNHLTKKMEATYAEVCNLSEQVFEQILVKLGFTCKPNDLLSKNGRKILIKNGTHALFRHLEETKNPAYFSYLRALAKEISFINPKEWQIERHRKFIIHAGPTNSGKTYQALQAVKKAKRAEYLAPIRLLAAEVQEKLSTHGLPCELVTGEECMEIKGATHRASTIDLADYKRSYDVAVIDEMQYVGDDKRGYHWVKSIFGLNAAEIHLCGAEHAVPLIKRLIQECGDDYEEQYYTRKTPLLVDKESFEYPVSIRKGDAIVAFSKAQVLKIAKQLKIYGFKVSVIYGRLPKEIKKKQAKDFIEGRTEVLVATDAIGIGLNLPIQRIVFSTLEKFDGNQKRRLTVQEIKQIAGRAGRKGKYDVGYVTAFTENEKNYIEKTLLEKEEEIDTSYFVPDFQLLELEKGTMRQKLLAWQMAKFDSPYFKKADIQPILRLLSFIEEWEFELDKETFFQVLMVRFNQKDAGLVQSWRYFVKQIKDNEPILRPRLEGNRWKDLEQQYERLNLYEYFVRKFGKKVSTRWIEEEQEDLTRAISEKIQQIG